MLVFPQLSTGAVSVYPVRRTRRVRTVVNSMLDGSAVVFDDSDLRGTEWDLEAVGLTRIEADAIQTLFAAVRGQEGSFTFLEPAGNLLARSENFGAEEWQQSGTVNLTGGTADPWGTARATRLMNTGPALSWLGQTLAVPAEFQYALSVWVRSQTAEGAVLFAEASGSRAEIEIAVSGEWKRVAVPISIGVASETVRFGVQVGAGKALDLVGMHVDAQPGPGAYQKTLHRSGVHREARFGMDELAVRARGLDVFDCAIRIVSKGS